MYGKVRGQAGLALGIEGRRRRQFFPLQKNFLYCLIFPEDFTRGSGRIYKFNYTSRIIELIKRELFGLALVEAITTGTCRGLALVEATWTATCRELPPVVFEETAKIHSILRGAENQVNLPEKTEQYLTGAFPMTLKLNGGSKIHLGLQIFPPKAKKLSSPAPLMSSLSVRRH